MIKEGFSSQGHHIFCFVFAVSINFRAFWASTRITSQTFRQKRNELRQVRGDHPFFEFPLEMETTKNESYFMWNVFPHLCAVANCIPLSAHRVIFSIGHDLSSFCENMQPCSTCAAVQHSEIIWLFRSRQLMEVSWRFKVFGVVYCLRRSVWNSAAILIFGDLEHCQTLLSNAKQRETIIYWDSFRLMQSVCLIPSTGHTC